MSEEGKLEVTVIAFGNEEIEEKVVSVPNYGDIPLGRVSALGGVTKNLRKL